MRTRLRSSPPHPNRGWARLVLCLVASLAAALHAPPAIAQDDEPNNTPATASPVTLALGDALSIAGSLDESGTDFDYYAIAMTERQILIATTKPEGGVFDIPDTQIRVLDTDGTTEFVENDDAGNDFPEGNEYGSTIRFRAPAAGTYYLVVTGCCDQADHGESGGYELLVGLTIEITEPTLDTDPANDGAAGADDLGIDGGGAVLHVATLEDRAEPPGDVDMYSVSLGGGDTLIATTVPFGGVLDVPDTEMAVFDGVTWFVINDDAGERLPRGRRAGSTVRFKAPSTGVYYLVISGFPDGDDDALDGDHTETGDYAVVASVVLTQEAPEIPTLSQTGLGALVAPDRRSGLDGGAPPRLAPRMAFTVRSASSLLAPRTARSETSGSFSS